MQPTEALQPWISLPLPAHAWLLPVGGFPDRTRTRYLHPGKAFKASCCVFSKAL